MAACQNLPPEMAEFCENAKVEIFTYLDLKSVHSVLRASKAMSQQANHSFVWERQIR